MVCGFEGVAFRVIGFEFAVVYILAASQGMDSDDGMPRFA